MSKNNDKKDIYNLLSEYKVIVPIIQRDYVQGRMNDEAKRVREGLIGSFYACLSAENEKLLDLNYISGYYQEKSGKNIFFPVDGQQRLTALYLLHWYLAICSEKQECIDIVQDLDFSYETRFSAESFFEQMMKRPSHDLMTIIRKLHEKDKKNEIKNLPEFQIEWKNNPTVMSALVFLEELAAYKDNVFGKKKNAETFFKRLVHFKEDNGRPVPDGTLGRIQFSFIADSDANPEQRAAKNYIKMNARGKSLTEFENLKAMFDKIESNIGLEGEKLSALYDKQYIHALFSYAKPKYAWKTVDLIEITKRIDDYSCNLYERIFPLCELKRENEKMIDTVFYESRNEKTQNPEKYQFFFGMIKAFLEFFCFRGNTEKYNDVFSKMFDSRSTDRRNSFVAYYIYLFKKEHGNIPTEKEMDKLIETADFVLESGTYTNDFLKEFAQKAAEFNDIEEMFLAKKKWSELKEYLKADRLNNFEVRLHEWWLRCVVLSHPSGLVKKENISVLTSDKTKQLPFLFYISDMWDKDSQEEVTENIEKLQKNFDVAKNFLPVDNDKKIRNLQYYAAACYWDVEKNDFYPPEKINQECKKYQNWNQSYHTWTNDSEIKEDKLSVIRRMYENYDSITERIDTLKKLDKNDNFRKCWLTYALILGKEDLLACTLEFKKGRVIKKRGYYEPELLFDVVVLKNISFFDDNGENTSQTIQYGFNDFSPSVPEPLRLSFDYNDKFNEAEGEGFTVERSDSGYDKYNLTILPKIKTDGINKSFADLPCHYVHYYDGKKYKYIIRKCNPSEQFGEYEEYAFDSKKLESFIEEINSQSGSAQNLLNTISQTKKLRWGVLFFIVKYGEIRDKNKFKATGDTKEITEKEITIKHPNEDVRIVYNGKEYPLRSEKLKKTVWIDEFATINYDGKPDKNTYNLYDMSVKSQNMVEVSK